MKSYNIDLELYRDIKEKLILRLKNGSKYYYLNDKIHDRKINIGDIIEVSVGGKIYLSEIDEHHTQRFLEIKDYYKKYDNGEYDLNQLMVDYIDGKMTQREYAELNIGIAYSVNGFSELHNFHDMQLINPLWDYTHPEDIYLKACFDSGKKDQVEITQLLAERDSISENDAKELFLKIINP